MRVLASVTNTQGIIAIAAGGVAVVALLCCAALALRLRRMRRAQQLVVGRAPLGHGRDEVQPRAVGHELERHVTTLTGDATPGKGESPVEEVTR